MAVNAKTTPLIYAFCVYLVIIISFLLGTSEALRFPLAGQMHVHAVCMNVNMNALMSFLKNILSKKKR